MILTPRRRAVIAILVGFPLGWIFVDVGWHLGYALLQVVRNSEGFVNCSSGLPGLVNRFNGCGATTYQWPYAVVELALMTVAVLVIAYGLARWVVWPIVAVADAVGGFGPNSLGLRLRASGPRDETRRLADAIDAMLDRLADGYEAQRRFAANASHELRTPLATQRALIEVSLRAALTPDQLDLLARQLLATNERNEHLVDGLLTLAETEGGVVSWAPVRLDALVADVVETWRPAALAGGIDVHCALEPVTVHGETALLERLFGNLVQNAIKYNEPGGWVRVSTAGQRCTVANSGAVVAAEQVGALFEPFHRMSGERLDHSGGVGLGLTIARSITAAHRGSITAHPNPGGGLVVEVSLP